MTHNPLLCTNRNARTAQGFALPLAILVIVLVVSVSAVMLERIGADARRSSLQVQEYRDHHLAQGLRRVISAWLRQYTASELAEVAKSPGVPLEITLADGRHVRVSLRDGQGTILAERGGLGSEQERDEALGLLDGLALVVPDPTRRELFTRDHGPYRVSVNSASPEVLGALAWLALADESQRIAGVDRVLQERVSTGVLTSSDIAQINNDITTDPVARQRLSVSRNGLIVINPEAWMVMVEVAPSRSAPAAERFEGLALVSSSRNAAARTTSGRSVWDNFMNWRRAPLDSDEALNDVLNETQNSPTASP